MQNRKITFSAENRPKEYKLHKRGGRVPARVITGEASSPNENFSFAPKNSETLLDAYGRERPSPIPMAPPIGYKKQPSMIDNIRDMVRREMSQQAAAAGMETFEEADDFEIDDDYDPKSPHEMSIEQELAGAPQAPQQAPSSPPPTSPTTPPVEPSGDLKNKPSAESGGTAASPPKA